MQKFMFLIALLWLLTDNVAAIHNLFLRGQMSKRQLNKSKKANMDPKKVQVCRYDAVLRKFKKVSVKKVKSKAHSGKHRPGIGHEDVTVADANLLPGSKDCKCVDGYNGDGVHCVATDSCDVNPCKNGDCTVTWPKSYKCTCFEGWTGTLCNQRMASIENCLNEAPLNTIQNVGLDRVKCKEFLMTTLWPLALQQMEDLNVPRKYFDPSNYSADAIADKFLAFIFDGKRLTPDDFNGFREAFNLNVTRDKSYNVPYNSRTLKEESVVSIDRPRSLASAYSLKVSHIVLDLLILVLAAVHKDDVSYDSRSLMDESITTSDRDRSQASDKCYGFLSTLFKTVLIHVVSHVGLKKTNANIFVAVSWLLMDPKSTKVVLEASCTKARSTMNSDFFGSLIKIFFKGLKWTQIEVAMARAFSKR